jgi:hypothetical protein
MCNACVFDSLFPEVTGIMGAIKREARAKGLSSLGLGRDTAGGE